MTTAVFGAYSKYYDLLYKDKDYEAEANYIANMLGNAKDILELGCGTGKHAYLLKQKGYDVYGIDLSESMIEKAKELGNNCEVADVRDFRMNKQFDAVISLFHIASYQTTDEDITNYFKTASYHLNKGGKFIFDLWYKPAVLAQLPEKRIKELENDDIRVKRYCTPNHLIEKSIVEVNYDIEITDKKTGMVEKIHEVHAMRYYSDEEIKLFASKAGIKIVKSEEWLTKAVPSEKTWGVCFIGEKQ